MLVVYFKNDNTGFREQGFSLQLISAKFEDCSKAKIVNNLTWRPEIERNRVTLLSEHERFGKQSGLISFNFGF